MFRLLLILLLRVVMSWDWVSFGLFVSFSRLGLSLPCACISTVVVVVAVAGIGVEAIIVVLIIGRPHAGCHVFMPAFAAYCATDGCSDYHEHHERCYEKESSDLHAEDDCWRAIIVEVFAALW
jgi:hypothetical protein